MNLNHCKNILFTRKVAGRIKAKAMRDKHSFVITILSMETFDDLGLYHIFVSLKVTLKNIIQTPKKTAFR